jgi:HEAT repeat protein
MAAGVQLPPDGAVSVQELVSALKSGNEQRQLAAALLMSELAQKATITDQLLQDLRDAGAALPPLLDSPNEELRIAAIEAIGHVRPRLSVGLDYTNLSGEAFAKAVRQQSPRIRQAIMRAIGFSMTRTLQDARSAAEARQRLPLLREMLKEATTFSGPLVLGIGDASPEVRAAALGAATTLVGSIAAVDDLMRLFGPLEFQADEDGFARLKALLSPLASAFAKLSQSAAVTLQKADHESQLAATRILQELAELVRNYPRRTPEGLLLNDRLAPAGNEAARILDAELAKALPVLAARLNGRDAALKLAALDALEMLGAKAQPVMAAVIAATKDPDRFVRWAAARTLGRLDTTSSRAPILALADLVNNDEDYDVRRYAIRTLEMLGPSSVPAISALERSLEQPDVELQITTLDALRAIGVEARLALPTILAVLKDGDVRVRRLIPSLLANLGPAAQPAVPALQEAMRDPDPDVRQAAGRAILRILATP